MSVDSGTLSPSRPLANQHVYVRKASWLEHRCGPLQRRWSSLASRNQTLDGVSTRPLSVWTEPRHEEVGGVLPLPVWSDFAGTCQGIWAGAVATYNPSTGAARPMGKDAAGKPLYLAHEVCIERRVISDESDYVLTLPASASHEGVTAEDISTSSWWTHSKRHHEDPGLFFFDGGSYSAGPAVLPEDGHVLLEHCLAWSSDHRVRVGFECNVLCGALPGRAGTATLVVQPSQVIVVTERWLGVPGVWVEEQKLEDLQAFVPRGVAAAAPEPRLFKGHWRRCGTRAEPVDGVKDHTDDDGEPTRHYESLEEWVAVTAGDIAADDAIALLLPPQLLIQLEWTANSLERGRLTLHTLWQPAQGVVLGMERRYEGGRLDSVLCTTAIESGPD